MRATRFISGGVLLVFASLLFGARAARRKAVAIPRTAWVGNAFV
jgi:hypothetical protein